MSMLVVFGTMAVLLFLTVPIAISIGLSVIAGLLYQGLPLIMAAQNCFTAVDSFALMGLPFYMLCGTLMVNGGTAQKLIDFAKSLVGWVTGGMGFITTLSCMFFGAISGSAPGTTAAIGSLMVPAMKRAGYRSELAASIISCAGTIGVIIPPSIPFVIYGVVSGVSVADMFIAGIIPGILIGLGLMVVCYFMARKERIPRETESLSIKQVFKSLWEAKWAMMVPVIILGGIYSGVFTPTESAVIACVYSLIVGVVVYRQINFRTLMDSLIDACLMTGTTLIINGISSAFGQLLTIQKIPTTIANFMLSLSNDPNFILLLIIAVLLIVGCFFETLSAIIILTPIFLPVVKMFGMDPIHFGIVLVCGLAIGFVTPPLGTTLFLGAQLAETTLEKTLKYLWPFLLMMVVTLLAIAFIPGVSMSRSTCWLDKEQWMKILTRVNCFYSFDREQECKLWVDQGERFRAETFDCRRGHLQRHDQLLSSAPSWNTSQPQTNPCTGPIGIRDICAGDTLRISIHKIDLEKRGFIIQKKEMGICKQLVDETKVIFGDITDDGVKLECDLTLPLRPHIGSLGLTPLDAVATGFADRHGGNMDCRFLEAGSALYLPVQVNGGALGVGDIHATMGCGELMGTGVEVSGAVELSAERAEEIKINGPVLCTQDTVMTIAAAPQLQEALEIASAHMVDLLERYGGYSRVAALSMLTAICDAGFARDLIQIFFLLPLFLFRVSICPNFIL